MNEDGEEMFEEEKYCLMFILMLYITKNVIRIFLFIFLLLLLCRHENDEDFLTQILVFDEQKQQDDDMMVTGDGLDLNDHQQVFRAVFDQVSTKSYKMRSSFISLVYFFFLFIRLEQVFRPVFTQAPIVNKISNVEFLYQN